MKSPFAIFRKHQRTSMVILVGLSLIAFVLFDAFMQSDEIPTPLIIITAMLVVGGAGWIWGMQQDKASEYGMWGVILGAALAFGIVFAGRKPAEVYADSGSLSSIEVYNLQQQRETANRFMVEAIRATHDERTGGDRLGRFQFGLGLDGSLSSRRDVVTGELLRREAHRLGLVATDASVSEYIKQATDNKITAEQFNKIRTEMRISEKQLYDALRAELEAKMASELMYQFPLTQPPEQYWEYFRQLYVKQTCELAAVPVSEFIDESAEPPPAELEQLFAQYRENVPNFTKEGRLDEGRPGFLQPRRVKLAVLEAVYDDAAKLVAAVTEDEIKTHYEEQIRKPAEERAKRAAELPATPTPPKAGESTPGPSLPGTPPTETPAPAETPSGAAPASVPEGDADSDPKTPSDPTPPESGESPSEPGACGDEPESSSAEQPSTPAAENPSTEAPGTPAASGEKPAESPPASTTSESEPAEAAGTPPVSTPVSGNEDAADPPTPQPAVPLLDEALKETIRKQLQDERVNKKLEEIANAASIYVQDNIGRFVFAVEDDPEKITPATATERAEKYAADQGLHYEETPLLSQQELVQSEDYRVGMAYLAMPGQQNVIAGAVFQTGAQDRYRPMIARSDETQSWYVVWKLDEQDDPEPKLSDERVKEQVVKTWRELQAREKAQMRAAELAQLARDSGKDLSEALAEQHVTSSADSPLVTVLNTGEFYWKSVPGLPRPGPYSFQGPPQLSSPAGVEKAGPAFMQTVFDELGVGDVGVAPNADRSVFYVAKVVSRTPSKPEELEELRKKFMEEPLFEGLFNFPSVYQQLAVREVQENGRNWVTQLWDRHKAVMIEREK